VKAIVIRGGRRLEGTVSVSGSKNAALPILFASLLTEEPCTFRNVPNLADIRTATKVLRHLGASVEEDHASGEVRIDAGTLVTTEAPYDLVKTMRASFLVLGPLLARMGRARVSTPGGCAIGGRPVGLHLAGLERLGARFTQHEGYVEGEAERLRGGKVLLDFPSVGATQQLMMAAALAEGTTVIENAAREPENVCLAEVLTVMGARVEGAGTAIVRVDGVARLGGVEHTIIPDRIEAGSLILAAAITGGDVRVVGARGEHLDALVEKLREAGAYVEELDDAVRIRVDGPLRSVDIRTMPYPGFPTDLQAQTMALATQAAGVSTVVETVFENRFMHAPELVRMGADIKLDGHQAVVRGPVRLSGAQVMATDLRASMSLVLAGLVADGETRIDRVYHLDRGYERLEEKLRGLGADIERQEGAA
jgi:UDP-N-acetylglucosamine 1-carboxyvinyltransferase